MDMRKVNDERFQMQHNITIVKDEDKVNTNTLPTFTIPTFNTIPKYNDSKGGGQGTAPMTGKASVDYNNYFANAQKVESCDGKVCVRGAAMENYYSAEILNLKFNPNAKTRYGMLCIAIFSFAV